METRGSVVDLIASFVKSYQLAKMNRYFYVREGENRPITLSHIEIPIPLSWNYNFFYTIRSVISMNTYDTYETNSADISVFT